jgi:hypothetical protein
MMKAIQTKVLTSALALASLAGCMSTTPQLDSKFGQAVNAAKAQQTIDPEAGQKADPVTGVDGVAAKEAFDRYRESFKSPPPVTNIINIGGGGGDSR